MICFLKQIINIKKDTNEINNFNSNIKKIQDGLSSLIEKNDLQIQGYIKKYEKNIKNCLEKKKEGIEEQLRNKKYYVILEEINKEISSKLGTFNDDVKEFLEYNEKKSNNYFRWAEESLNNFIQAKKYNLNIKGKIKEFISGEIGDKENDLIKEIIDEIKNTCESLGDIYSQKGFKGWFFSLFSSQYTLENIIDMIIKTSLDKINWIFMILINSTYNYLNELKRSIDICAAAATLKFNDDQLAIWKDLQSCYKNQLKPLIEEFFLTN